jgi:hypothetical protein
MDTEDIAAFLINGGLVTMLSVGKTVPTMAWIVADETLPSGFRLVYERSLGSAPVSWGGKFVPSYSHSNGKLTKPSRQEVAQFLSDSFGLRQEQAARVLMEARAECSPHVISPNS